MKVLAPGIGAAVRAHLTAHRLTYRDFTRQTGLSAAQIGRIVASSGVVSESIYAVLARVITTPWTTPHCQISDRPGGAAKQSAPISKARDYTTRRLVTPNLDAFNGMEGAWL